MPWSVSAVIPSLDRPQVLMRAIESVLAQTLPPRDVIVVDDGSQPPLSHLLAELPDTVQVVRNETPTGPAAARNLGVQHASGDFIAFLDDDDKWLPRKLEEMHKCLTKHPFADVAIHRTGTKPGTRGSAACSVVGDPLARMLLEQPPHLDGIVVRRSLHLESPFDESFAGAEDLDYLIRLANSGVSMVEVPATLALLGPSSDTAIGTDKRIEGRLRLLERHPEILEDPRALAFFYLRLGHQYRRSRQRARSLAAFARSIASRPTIAAVRGVMYALLPSSALAAVARRQSPEAGE